MKINLSELQQLYQEYLQKFHLQSRDKCPSPETLLKYSRKQQNRKTRIRIIDHIARCPSCARELLFIQGILHQEQSLNQEISDNLNLKASKFRNNARLITEGFSWLNRRVILIFAASLLLVTTAVFFLLRLPEGPDYRADRLNRIRLIYPTEGRYSLSNLSFQWSEIPSADYYILEIYNEELYPIWESGKLIQNTLIPSPELLAHFEHNKIYFWMVRAFFRSGNTVESRLQIFTVRR